MTVTWDYTELAAHYDLRADYCSTAIDRLLSSVGVKSGTSVADVGAGTGKLALPLARRGCIVTAVEPNLEMRKYGVRNTQGLNVTWSRGTAEKTGLPSGQFRLATFGSSFNVVDRAKALAEVDRLLTSDGWIACLWNHRDLQDPLQAKIEGIIRQQIPQYDYGTRREDPTAVMTASGLFSSVMKIEEPFIVSVSGADYIEAWRSHATLHRQAGKNFSVIIAQIAAAISQRTSLTIPYVTRIWYAQRAGAVTSPDMPRSRI
jgi:ubiquinone/menaquinone biosynthesis C-methylase UbiE